MTVDNIVIVQWIDWEQILEYNKCLSPYRGFKKLYWELRTKVATKLIFFCLFKNNEVLIDDDDIYKMNIYISITLSSTEFE